MNEVTFLDDVVVKVYSFFSADVLANELHMLDCSMEEGMRLNLSVTRVGDTLTVITKRGETDLGEVTDEDIVDLIRHLAVIEDSGLVHGDIKPDNIVRLSGKLRMIDYETMSTKEETRMRLQTFRDEYGEAHFRGYLMEGYGAIGQAMYALGVTILLLKGVISHSEATSVTSYPCTFFSSTTVMLSVMSHVPFIKERAEELCEHYPILTDLIGAPASRSKSFWDLLPSSKR